VPEEASWYVINLDGVMWHCWARGGLLVLSAALASFLFYLLAVRVESVPSPTSASPGALERADAGFEGFTFVQSRAGSVQWEVRAHRGRLLEAESRAILEQVQVTLFGANGWELRLQGDEGTIDTARKDFVLVKHAGLIAVELQNGYTIYTNHLAWTDAQGEISTRDLVTISGQGMEITGRGLIGKLDGEEFQILENVRVELSQ
jgi:lipopolysaccharide export system protein LptC